MREEFRRFAKISADFVGFYRVFMAAFILVVSWGIIGPFARFSNTWQLVMNTISSVVTFLIVFLIQNTQNRDTLATQLKLDELVRAVQGAKLPLIALEDLSDQQLQSLERTFREYRKQQAAGAPSTDSGWWEILKSEDDTGETPDNPKKAG